MEDKDGGLRRLMEEEDDGKGLWRRMMEDHLKHNESRLDTEMYQHHRPLYP